MKASDLPITLSCGCYKWVCGNITPHFKNGKIYTEN